MTAILFHTSAWLQTYVRARTYQFTDPFALDEPAVFFVKSGNSFDWRDITGKTIGFGDGWVWDEFCIARDPNIEVSHNAILALRGCVILPLEISNMENATIHEKKKISTSLVGLKGELHPFTKKWYVLFFISKLSTLFLENNVCILNHIVQGAQTWH